jgi:hypothetical protein
MLMAVSEIPFILFKGEHFIGTMGEGKFANKFMVS